MLFSIYSKKSLKKNLQWNVSPDSQSLLNHYVVYLALKSPKSPLESLGNHVYFVRHLRGQRRVLPKCVSCVLRSLPCPAGFCAAIAQMANRAREKRDSVGA